MEKEEKSLIVTKDIVSTVPFGWSVSFFLLLLLLASRYELVQDISAINGRSKRVRDVS